MSPVESVNGRGERKWQQAACSGCQGDGVRLMRIWLDAEGASFAGWAEHLRFGRMESLSARPQLRLLHTGTKISHHLEHPALPGAIKFKNLLLPLQIVFLVVRGYPRISNGLK